MLKYLFLFYVCVCVYNLGYMHIYVYEAIDNELLYCLFNTFNQMYWFAHMEAVCVCVCVRARTY